MNTGVAVGLVALVIVGVGIGVAVSSSSKKSSKPKPPSGPNDMLEGWPFPVVAGEVQGLRFFRVLPLRPLGDKGPVTWVLHGTDTDPRKLAPFIPTGLSDVVFIQAPEGWKSWADANADIGDALGVGAGLPAARLGTLALQRKLPGPFTLADGVYHTQPWIVVGYDTGADVALDLMRAPALASPHAVVAAAPAAAPDVNRKGTNLDWVVFLVGDKDPIAAKVLGAVETLSQEGFSPVARVVPDVGRDLPALGPQLRDLLLDVITMFPNPVPKG